MMFPVYTGINRTAIELAELLNDVPCIHRDKPIIGGRLKI